MLEGGCDSVIPKDIYSVSMYFSRTARSKSLSSDAGQAVYLNSYTTADKNIELKSLFSLSNIQIG